MTDTRENIRRNLITARHDAGLSQRALAEAVGAHRTQVVEWEAGKYRVSDTYLDRIAEATGHTPGWFLDAHDGPGAAA
jgi:transcriptional regulator with XRE-family HTH domain